MIRDSALVARIFKVAAAPQGIPWMWTPTCGRHADRFQTHGYEASRQAAMKAFARAGSDSTRYALTRPPTMATSFHCYHIYTL
jgi:hypothetical protein